MPRPSTLAAALALAALATPALSGNTTCAGNALDWYTSAVGETPSDDVFAYVPRARTTEKQARMQRHGAGSGTGTGTGTGSGGTRDSSALGSGLGSELGTGAPTESAGSEAGLLDSREMLLQEEDAGRIAGGIRLPPAYRSEWGDE
ncbi:predicted protein [Postia placenta Mad-698-R]|nr:predicted protein [Postia placenta Mad-698-R]